MMIPLSLFCAVSFIGRFASRPFSVGAFLLAERAALFLHRSSQGTRLRNECFKCVIVVDLSFHCVRSSSVTSTGNWSVLLSQYQTRAPSIYINHICQTFRWTLYVNYIYVSLVFFLNIFLIS